MSDPRRHSELSAAQTDTVSPGRPVDRRWSWWRRPDPTEIDSFWHEQPLKPWWSWWHLLELAAVFAAGACLMNFLYVEAATAGGVSGHDSWYHVKMAELLPEIGATEQFRWLRYVYFTEYNDEFISHHFGFHALMVPFVYAAKWMGADALTGGRWAISFFFTASLTLFQLILMTQRVRCRWLWLGLYLLMPSQFFSRQAFVRAIAPSLMFMFLIMVLIFRRRYLWAGLAVAAYTNLYLGGVVFAPLIVVCYVVAGLVGPRGDRVSWGVVACTLAGWAVGVLIYPYSEGIYEFLRLQIFGSGLGADISVGREWKPYEKVWWLTMESAWTLIPLGVATCLRLRFGPRINARELSVLLLSFVFGGLMLKSRRFVEYWPAFAMLAAALLSGPVIDAGLSRLTEWLQRARPWWRRWPFALGLVVICGGVIALVVQRGQDLHIKAMRDHWHLWAAVAAAYLLVPLARYWHGARVRPHKSEPGGLDRLALSLVVPLAGVVFVAAVYGIVCLALGQPSAKGIKLFLPWWTAVALLTVYVSVSLWSAWRTKARSDAPFAVRLIGLGGIVLVAVTFVGWLIVAAGPQMVKLQRKLRPKFDLAQIRPAMDALIQASEPKSVVFTDDWDIFPVYFYVNSYNSYIVGLDPKFTEGRDPILWERYKKISRGQTPAWHTVQDTYGGGPPIKRKLRIRLQDIRDHFGAQYVIVDQDHKPFRRKLDAADAFCERIYPPPEADDDSAADAKRRHKTPPYVVYRVFSRLEQAAAEAAAGQARREKLLRAAERRRAGPASRPTSRPAGPQKPPAEGK